MKCVGLISPYAGATQLNKSYLRAALRDSLTRNEAPFAPHAIYPRALDDLNREQRMLGLQAGYYWLARVDYIVAYVDLGWSAGMLTEKQFAADHNIRLEERRLPDWVLLQGKNVGQE